MLVASLKTFTSYDLHVMDKTNPGNWSKNLFQVSSIAIDDPQGLGIDKSRNELLTFSPSRPSDPGSPGAPGAPCLQTGKTSFRTTSHVLIKYLSYKVSERQSPKLSRPLKIALNMIQQLYP